MKKKNKNYALFSAEVACQLLAVKNSGGHGFESHKRATVLDKFIEEGTRIWSGIDSVEWVRNLRGGYN